jgi:hypothetical protein
MLRFKKVFLPTLVAGIWINLSETARWLLGARPSWVERYESLNLVLPDGPVTNLIWMIWGFLFAFIVYLLSKKHGLFQTTLIAWVSIFVSLWIVLWNVGILPVNMLWFVAPLSLIETFIAAWICRKMGSDNA